MVQHVACTVGQLIAATLHRVAKVTTACARYAMRLYYTSQKVTPQGRSDIILITAVACSTLRC